ncbi:MAG TPA: hypothetical protein VFI52_03055 [Gemmatimonadaceae bacterium]|nr:hypothetical protein [Gemmatimonadaceae bacterium]
MRSFSYRSARNGTPVAGLVLVIAIETLVLHLWLASRHPIIAWTLTVSSLAAIAWLVADYRALGRGAVRLATDALDLRIGRRFAVTVPTTALSSALRPTWRDLPSPGSPEAVGYLNLTKPAAPNVLLILSTPMVVRLPGGLRRSATRFALCLDEPDDFLAAIRPTPAS